MRKQCPTYAQLGFAFFDDNSLLENWSFVCRCYLTFICWSQLGYLHITLYASNISIFVYYSLNLVIEAFFLADNSCLLFPVIGKFLKRSAFFVLTLRHLWKERRMLAIHWNCQTEPWNELEPSNACADLSHNWVKIELISLQCACHFPIFPNIALIGFTAKFPIHFCNFRMIPDFVKFFVKNMILKLIMFSVRFWDFNLHSFRK